MIEQFTRMIGSKIIYDGETLTIAGMFTSRGVPHFCCTDIEGKTVNCRASEVQPVLKEQDNQETIAAD